MSEIRKRRSKMNRRVDHMPFQRSNPVRPRSFKGAGFHLNDGQSGRNPNYCGGISTAKRASRHRSAAGSKGERCRKGSSCTFPNHKLKTLKGFSSLSRLILGRFAGLGEGHRPIDERLHRRTERFAKLGEFIFHLWWKLRMNGSLHQLALLKETQLLRQHAL